MHKIITTVGTSIFTNFLEKMETENKRQNGTRITTALRRTRLQTDGSEVSANCIYEKQYNSHIEALQDTIRDIWFAYNNINEPNINASAEISSILSISSSRKEDSEVHLIASDTLLSVLAAELIKEWFDKYYGIFNVKISFERQPEVFDFQHMSDHVIKNLRVQQQADYDNGFMNLIEVLNKIVIPEKTVLNITGGYKGTIPILTLFGQLYETPLCYLYAESLNLVEQPPIVVGNLPLHFDLGYIENFVKFLQNPETLVHQTIANEMFALRLIKQPIPKSELSILGKLIKQKLESTDLPFQKTTLGYLVEFKAYEYFTRNPVAGFSKPILGYKLSNEPGKDLEDADLWFENDKELIIAEFKPLGTNVKNLRHKIKKIFKMVTAVSNKTIKEFWLIFYTLNPELDVRSEVIGLFNEEFLKTYANVKFRVKIIPIKKNLIDGERNRINYQEFMRTPLAEIPDVFVSGE